MGPDRERLQARLNVRRGFGFANPARAGKVIIGASWQWGARVRDHAGERWTATARVERVACVVCAWERRWMGDGAVSPPDANPVRANASAYNAHPQSLAPTPSPTYRAAFVLATLTPSQPHSRSVCAARRSEARYAWRAAGEEKKVDPGVAAYVGAGKKGVVYEPEADAEYPTPGSGYCARSRSLGGGRGGCGSTRCAGICVWI
ncbi:hypothetical protein B0H11DRAFT_1990716 [Mycena galericulata]|nr:hypothetical protein B0H11DRAFT_1990716 [Mycena galericulata]